MGDAGLVGASGFPSSEREGRLVGASANASDMRGSIVPGFCLLVQEIRLCYQLL